MQPKTGISLPSNHYAILMDLRQQRTFHILLLLFCFILVGCYLDLNVILWRLEPVKDQGVYMIYNPLSDIFTREHEFGSQRLLMFQSLVFFLLLPAVTIRYFATGRRHKGLLHASLAIYFWAGLGSLLNMTACYLWKTWTPVYIPDLSFDFDLQLAALPFLQVVLSFMLLRRVRTEDPGLTSSTAAQPVPITWMRVARRPSGPCEGVASVPAVLQLCGLYLMIVHFSGWVATITNHAENLARRETKERPMHFLLTLLCGVLIYRFGWWALRRRMRNTLIAVMAQAGPAIGITRNEICSYYVEHNHFDHHSCYCFG